MMEAGEGSSKRKGINDYGFLDMIFSWSIDDILNEDLYKNQVDKIELSFRSIGHYLGSFVYPLLEETRAQLCSSMEILYNAPFARVIGFDKAKPFGKKLYTLKIDGWKNRFTNRGKEPYEMLPGDVLVLADFKPETANDLQRMGRMWSFVSVTKTSEGNWNEDDSMSIYFRVNASKDIDLNEVKKRPQFVVFLANISPNRRIWKAIHMSGNLKLIKQILCTNDEVEESCNCSLETESVRDDCTYQRLTSELNEAQHKAISECLSSLRCNHKSTVKLIWGPPGTGKTKTLGTLLFALMKMKYRILICAPTNVAIKEVASRVLGIVRDSVVGNSGDLFCSVGDMLLFGNKERLKVGAGIEDIYLDYRVEQLTKCFSPSNGWVSRIKSMIDLLKNCVSQYHVFIENELKKDKNFKRKPFVEFLRERFVSAALGLKSCISILCTHIPRIHMLEHNCQNLVSLHEKLEAFEGILFQSYSHCEELEKIFSNSEIYENSSWSFKGATYQLYKKRNECLSALINVEDALVKLKLPNSFNVESIKEFCFQMSSLIFCTASGSHKLHSIAKMKPMNILVVDEAAQLKECESIIPMLLPEISNTILVGDECQLPAMVDSNVSSEVGFGRSLFERLSLSGHSKHLLNVQHRMHPGISLFPNSFFYFNQIHDAFNVQRHDYRKQYLPRPMFGPYSFINIIGGREVYDDMGRSRKNMAEVAVVMTILKNLHKAWLNSKEKLSIGIVSPYAGQILAIQEKLGHMYNGYDGFVVNVNSIDGFQGGEEDVILLSTVRTNSRSLGFISSPQRTNVALTRARHSLWILGSERALSNSDNVWKAVVLNARNRQCFFNADEDTELRKAILDSKKEMDQFDDLLDTNSPLFRYATWKVQFSDNFLRSFKRLRSQQTKNLVISLLERLSCGWRPPRRTQVDLFCENSSQMLNQFKVENLYVVCSIEIVKYSSYTQVLKMWDILPVEDIPKLAKHLESNFRRYTDDYISRCKEKSFDGNIEIPLSWSSTANIQKFRSVNEGSELNASTSDDRSYSENKVQENESLLLMKYNSVSHGHLLCSHNGSEFGLPFEVTEEERT